MAMATPTAGLSNLSIGGAFGELFFGTRAIALVVSLSVRQCTTDYYYYLWHTAFFLQGLLLINKLQGLLEMGTTAPRRRAGGRRAEEVA
jgi:hypothetical protein